MKVYPGTLALLALLVGQYIPGFAAPAPVEAMTPPGFHTLAIGDSAPDFSLPGVDGRTYTLSDFKSSPYLMVIFLSNHCPVSHAAQTRLLPFINGVKAKGLAVVAINPNNPAGLQIDELGYTKYDDTLAGMKGYARDSGFTFPYLYDGEGQKTAKAYGCLCTPHVFIFDRDRHLRYKGRYDDSEMPDPATVHSHDAENAVNAVLAGEPVSEPVTRPIGCATKWMMLQKVVEDFNESWKKLPVTVQPIDAAGVGALVHNGTDKLRLINVWATWCAPCVEEFPGMVSIARRLERRDFELITISMDDPKKQPAVLRFLEAHHAAVPAKSLAAVHQEGRETNNYLYTVGNAASLVRALDPEWPGPLPYTLVVAPGGEILARISGQVDPTELQNRLIDILGGFRKRPSS